MKLSVIVPVYNRVETLNSTLLALKDQSLSQDEFEVIVVDDGSNDIIRQQIRKCVVSCDYNLLVKKNAGLASARNLGASQAKGKILYFLDDDVIPGGDTLKQHLQSHDKQSEPVAIVGSLPFAKNIKLNPFIWYLEKCSHYDLYKNPKKYPQGHPPLPPMNGNSSILRELFFKIGKYDETFRHYGGEDLEFGYRLSKAGVKFIYNPLAIGYHNHDKGFFQFCKDMERAGESLIQVYKKYPEIRAVKKIDILQDRFTKLRGRKKLIKIILSLTLRYPWILIMARLIIRLGERYYLFRYFLFPLYRWVSQYYYAKGMQKGLAVEK